MFRTTCYFQFDLNLAPEFSPRSLPFFISLHFFIGGGVRHVFLEYQSADRLVQEYQTGLSLQGHQSSGPGLTARSMVRLMIYTLWRWIWKTRITHQKQCWLPQVSPATTRKFPPGEVISFMFGRSIFEALRFTSYPIPKGIKIYSLNRKKTISIMPS